MKLNHGLHLCYSTNIHRGETWPQTLAALEEHVLAVRQRVSPSKPYAIGLRLSHAASLELAKPEPLLEFRKWLDRHNCYVFTINGFPYGQFHGTRVKEQVYLPDWTSPERVDYTNRLFDILAEVLPPDCEGSVSTVPCSFKEFISTDEQRRAIRQNLWKTVEHIESVSHRTGKALHLGLEPEPMCILETSSETVAFLDQMRTERPGDDRLRSFLGVNYDTCHLAVEFEEPQDVIKKFVDHGIRISKLHLSSALKVIPTPEARRALEAFADDTYFHQVVARTSDGSLRRYRDLDVALASVGPKAEARELEWRIHFHIPIHSGPTPLFGNTSDHILGVMDALQANPKLCSHLEMETYTWEVMPAELKNRSVVEQLVSEYDWCLAHLRRRGLSGAA